MIFGNLEVDQLTFEKSFDVNAPVFATPGEGILVFSAPDGGEDFDEIAKFFGDFIPVEDYRAVTISFGDYDPTKFGEVGDLWLSSSELYEEERKDDCGADHHRLIVTALKAKDLANAQQLMDHHLADIEGRVRLTEGQGDRHTFLAVLENFS